MTHHHHGLILGNLSKFSGGHALGSFRPFGGKSGGGQKLSDCGLGFLGIFELIVLKYTFFYFSIGIGKGALPVQVAIPEFTDVFVPIGFGIGALPVLVAILVFTDCSSSPSPTFSVTIPL